MNAKLICKTVGDALKDLTNQIKQNCKTICNFYCAVLIGSADKTYVHTRTPPTYVWIWCKINKTSASSQTSSLEPAYMWFMSVVVVVTNLSYAVYSRKAWYEINQAHSNNTLPWKSLANYGHGP